MNEGGWSVRLTKIKDFLWPEKKLNTYKSEHDALKKYLEENLLHTDKILRLKKAKVSSVLTPLLERYIKSIKENYKIEEINIYVIGKRGGRSYEDDKWRTFLSEIISEYPLIKITYIFSFIDDVSKIDNDIWAKFKRELKNLQHIDNALKNNDRKLKYINLFDIDKNLAKFYTDYHVLIIDINASDSNNIKYYKLMWIEKEHIKTNEANYVEFHPHNALMTRSESIKKYQENMQRIHEIISLESKSRTKSLGAM